MARTAPALPDAAAQWSAEDCTPSQIEDALRHLLEEEHARDGAYAPARVLNLVVVIDAEWRGEILNRLERVGRYHASRTILCVVDRRRSTLSASAVMTIEGESQPGDMVLLRERVVVDVGENHLPNLDTVVDPLVITDLPTVVWSPHGHPDAVDALLHIAQIVLIDSVGEPDPVAALARARELSDHAYVVDLAWLRSTPWRERVAATFDPPAWRDQLHRIDSVAVQLHPDSRAAGVLFVGWLASRLGWGTGSLTSANGALRGRMHGERDDVTLTLEPHPEQEVPGLAGVEIRTSSGLSISLDRGPGGLVARRRDKRGNEQTWSVLGASRGEGGILGEGIRQALLRDPTYAQALACGEALLR